MTYVEIPERITTRITLGGILGTASFLALLLTPAAVEGGNYILALAMAAACGICAYLAIREDGKRK